MACRLGRADAASMSKSTTILVAIALVFGAFFFFPLTRFALRAFESIGSQEQFAAESFIPGLLNTLQFSSLQAFLSAALSVLIALPGAFALSRYRFPLRRFIQSLSLVSFVLPSIVVIICMISFYGRSGVLNSVFGTDVKLIYSFAGIIVAHIFFNYALALRIIGDGWSRIGDEYRNISWSLGSGKFLTGLRVTMPLLLPSILSAFSLIFIFCFMSFGIVLVFGGIRFSTLEVRIYQELYQKLNFGRGAAFALVQIGISTLFLVVSGRLGRWLSGSERDVKMVELKPLKHASPHARIAISIYWIAILVFLLGPIISMIAKSFITNNGLSIQSYLELFNPEAGGRNIEGIIRSDIPGVIGRSIAIALGSGAVTFTVALAAATALRGRQGTFWRGFFQLPMGMTVVGLAASLRLILGDTIPMVILVLAGQFFIAFPMVFRVTDTVVADLKGSLIECATSLGAKPARAFRTVLLPVLRRGLLNAYAFAVAVAFADFAVVLGVGRGEIVTFPVAVYRLIGFKSFDLALSLSTLYIGFCLLIFLLIDNTARGKR